MKIGYTTIMHEPRIKLDLTVSEYCVLDLVYRLSTNPTAPITGWCSMSKDNMHLFLGMTRRTLFNVLNRLEENGFLTKSSDGRLLQTTNKWIKNVVNFNFKISDMDSAKVALGDSAKFALGHSAKVALKNNINNNNKRENKNLAFSFLKSECESRLEQEILMKYKTKINDFEKFVLDFNDKVTIEKLDYDADVLLARLATFARNWINNQNKYTQPKQQQSNNGPLPSMD